MKKYLALSLFAALPAITSAQNVGNYSGLSAFINNTLTFVNQVLVPAVFALAFLVFIWGMVTAFIIGGQDDEKRKKGRQLMLWALIAFVVMISLWGIVNLFADGLGLSGQHQNVAIPQIP